MTPRNRPLPLGRGTREGPRVLSTTWRRYETGVHFNGHPARCCYRVVGSERRCPERAVWERTIRYVSGYSDSQFCEIHGRKLGAA
jgi:hypothetical protein